MKKEENKRRKEVMKQMSKFLTIRPFVPKTNKSNIKENHVLSYLSIQQAQRRAAHRAVWSRRKRSSSSQGLHHDPWAGTEHRARARQGGPRLLRGPWGPRSRWAQFGNRPYCRRENCSRPSNCLDTNSSDLGAHMNITGEVRIIILFYSILCPQ